MQVLILLEPDTFSCEATCLFYFLGRLYCGSSQSGQFPRRFWYQGNSTHSDSKRPGSPTFSHDCIVALVESREFPTQVLIPKEPDAFWSEVAWLSYFLWAIVLWLQPRVESSQCKFWYQRNLTHSGTKRLGSPTFYGRLYCGFCQESRVPRRILSQSGLALLLSIGNCFVPSTESQKFIVQVLIPKKLDELWPKATWLSYFVQSIVLWLQLRVLHTGFNTRTRPILDQAGWLSYFLRAIVASTESRVFPK